MPTKTPKKKATASGGSSSSDCSTCSCIKERDDKLRKEYGLKISDKCRQIQMPEFKGVYGLPLVKADGSRMKKTDPAFMAISHCPFCGKSLK